MRARCLSSIAAVPALASGLTLSGAENPGASSDVSFVSFKGGGSWIGGRRWREVIPVAG
jgi:hypothetical protein